MARSFLGVKNFEHFQHYKDRRPPWIKLYNELLEDYEFGCLQDASKAHLILIWLLASRYENRIPNDPEWIKRMIHATGKVDLDGLVSAGFLTVYHDASKPLAKRPDSAIPEIEVEKEKEEPKTLVRENADLAPIRELHDHFNTARGGRPLKLTTDRKAKYRARLRNYPMEDLRRAIDIALADPWLRGANDRATDFGFPETVFKNDASVDRWLSVRNGKAPGGVMTPEEFAERRKARGQVSPLLEQVARERAERLTSEEGAT